jgi:integrase
MRTQDAEVDEHGACAKFGHPRTVYVPADAVDVLDPYLLLERPEIVEKAQPTLRRRHRDLFVVSRLEADGAKVRGVLDGGMVTRSIRGIDPRLRRIAVRETGDGLDPLALFVGTGGRMLTASGWDRVRWAAWNRKAHADEELAGLVPRRCWVFHDPRHTFALRQLIYLIEVALDEHRRRQVPMSPLLDHMSGNPLLQVQRRLGHATPATTYRYINSLKDPMRDVQEAFRSWTGARRRDLRRDRPAADDNEGRPCRAG